MEIYLHLNINSKNNINNTPITNGYINYAQDTNEWFIDRGNHRLKVVNIIPISDQTTFNSLNDYIEQYLYIVMEDPYPMYIADVTNLNKDGLPTAKQIYKLSDIEGIVIQDPNTLEPTIITKNGIQYAPRTLLSAVYNQNGETIYSSVERLRMDMKNFQLSEYRDYKIYTQGQRVLNIPYPTRFFNPEIDSLIILRNNNIVSIDEYTLTSKDKQVIFNYGLNKNDIITFVFNYGRIKTQNSVPDKSVNLHSLNNEVYELLNESRKAVNITLEDGTNLQEIMNEVIDNMGTIGEYDDTSTNSVMGKLNNLFIQLTNVANSLQEKASQISVNQLKETIDTNNTTIVNTLTEILETSKVNGESIVKSVQRGVGKMKFGGITTEIPLEKEINPDKCIVILTGDSYYNETPYLYTLERNQLTVSQKSTVYNEDYLNEFSWQILEFN